MTISTHLRSRTAVAALLGIALAALLSGWLTTSTAHAAALPLGKARFVVSIGGLQASSTTNWVRIGQYTFATDGTVSERHWHWSQRTRVTRADTEFVASGCPTISCRVKTAGGYQSTGASQTLTGTYTVSGDQLRVTWSGGQREDWTLGSQAGGALAGLTYAGSNFGATHGFGYGSNAAWDARASMAAIDAVDHSRLVHTYYLWKTTAVGQPPFIDTGDGSPFWVRNWTVCGGGNCLGALTGTAPATTQYYVSPANSPTGHRRDTMWSWRTQNLRPGETCYQGNSHVKPMLQIIDDNGAFHGWVGVEASLNQTVPSQGALADDIGVFRIAG